jgi:DNA-binding response OmpR family regulator
MASLQRVLVVDDEPYIADSLALIFHQNGYEARPVYGAAEALAILSEFRPSVVVTDVAMPDVNGVELAIRVRELCPSIRLLLLSGQASTEEVLTSAERYGHRFDVVAKPIHPSELLSRLESLLAA